MIVKPYGMLLCTGPTGSGKSTTVYSMLKKINKPDINIITLEDPVEYRMEKIRQIQTQSQSRDDLCQRPEIHHASGPGRDHGGRDPGSGNRIHRCPGGPDRPPGAEHRSHQRRSRGHHPFFWTWGGGAVSGLFRHAGFHCPSALCERFAITAKSRMHRAPAVLAYWGLDNVQGANFMQGTGCFNCMDKGFKGRTGVYEVLLIDEMVQEMVLQQKTAPGDLKSGPGVG